MKALIDRCGMQHIVDTAAELFGNSVFICDLGYKILCYSDHDATYDDFWEYVKNYNYSIPEQMIQIMRTGDFARIYSTDEPLIGKYSFAEFPFLAARIRDGSHVLGHVCIYGSRRDFCAEDNDLLVLLCKVISYEMLYRGISKPYEIPYYTLLADLLEGNLTDEQELQMRLKCLQLHLPPQMHLVIIDFLSSTVQTSIFYIREYLAQNLPDTLSIVYKNQLILLTSEAVIEHHLLEKNLSGYETSTDYRIGVSNLISGLQNLPVYYQQASDSIRIAGLIKMEGRLCLYKNLKIYQLLLYAEKEIDLHFLCDPVVLAIRSYDQQYHTEYLNDLIIYLNCGKNINKAAKEACVHKNSMYYRISKMEELFSFSFEDEETCLSLQLSLRILRLLNP